MRIKIMLVLILLIFLSPSTLFNATVYAVEERKVLSRNYVGFGVEVFAPYQCYSSENITVRVRVKAFEDIKNASVTMFIWGSKSEGSNPWGASFTVIDVSDFLGGAIKVEAYNVTIPSDIDPGLTYGILFLDWSIYRSPSWEDQWDKANFRMTYVKNKKFEDLQTTYSDLQDEHNSVLTELQNNRTLIYLFLATTIALTFSTVYFARSKPKVN